MACKAPSAAGVATASVIFVAWLWPANPLCWARHPLCPEVDAKPADPIHNLRCSALTKSLITGSDGFDSEDGTGRTRERSGRLPGKSLQRPPADSSPERAVLCDSKSSGMTVDAI